MFDRLSKIARVKRINALFVALIYTQTLAAGTARTISTDRSERPVNLAQTEPVAAPAVLRDDNFLDPRGTEYVSKWLKAGTFMPLSELKPGMQGYGLSVFQGNKIERFDVTVIGVVKKVLSGRDAIMVRLSGPLMGKNTVIRGMSGSPVYINGKLVGAVSYGFDFSKEPIVGLTPITDMLDALTPDKRPPDETSGPGRIGYRALPTMGGESGYGSAGGDPAVSSGSNAGIVTTSGGGARMVPLIAPISLSGFSNGAQALLGEHFKNFGMSVSAGTAGAIDETLDDDSNVSKNYPAETIKPGGAVSVLLVTGDFSASATGTATTTFGGKVLAFGHPFMQAGPVEFPMATAHIHQILPNLAVSFKVASPVKVVGTVTNDRPWAIGGELGRQAKMIPATYTVSDRTRGVKKTFHLNVINHAELTPELLASTAMSAIDTTHQSTSPYVVTVDSKIVTDKAGTIERHDKFAGNFAVHGPVDSSFKLKMGDSTGTSFLSVLTRITGNDFEKASIKGVNLNIVLDDGHDTARLERISLDKQKVEPGETVKITAVLRPYNKPRVTRELSLKVPRDIPDGNLLLGVGPGDQIDQLRKRMGIVDPQPENLQQVANRIREQGQGNVLEAVLALPEQSLFLDGRRIVSPPGHWLKLFFSDRYTKGPQIVKGEVRARASEPWLLDGMHLLALTVERKEKALAQSPSLNINPTNSFSSHDGIYMTDQARKTLDSSGSRKSESSSTTTSTTGSLASAIASSLSNTSSTSSSSEKRDTSSSATTFAAAKQYPHMRSALAWRQSTEEDFRNGKTEEVAIDSRGRLSPGFHEAAKCSLSSTSSINPKMQIWSADCHNGSVFFAAHNKVYVWKSGVSAPEQIAQLDCSFSPAITVDSKGNVFAATAPGDRVVIVKPQSEKHDILFKTGGDMVTTLCTDDNDNVFAGVAGDGKVWRYDAAKKTAAVIFDSGQAHITALSFSKADKRIYVGTAEKGAVYSIDQSGNARAEYQTNDHIVTGAVKDKRGNLFVATAGQGHLFKVKPSGEADTLATSEGFYSLVYDPSSDTVFAGDAEGDITQARQEEVSNRPYFVPVAHTDEEAVSALSLDGQGHLFAATSNFARCFKFDLSPSLKATYSSQIRDAQRPAQWSKLLAYGGLNEIDPSLLTRLSVDTRTGNSSRPDASWSPWNTTDSTSEGFNIKSPRGRYLQYRLRWKPAEKGTATGRKGQEPSTIRKIDVTYLPNNAQPVLSSISVQAGAHVSGKQELSISGTDADHDNMLLSLAVSSDGGKSWDELAADLRSKKDTSKDSKDKKKDAKQDKPDKTDASKTAQSDSKFSADLDKSAGLENLDLSDKDVKGEVKEKSDDSSDGDAKKDSAKEEDKQSKKLSEIAQKPKQKDEGQAKKPDGPEGDKNKQADKPKNDQPKDPKDSKDQKDSKDSKDQQSKDSLKDKSKSKGGTKDSAETTLAKALSAIKSATQSESESQTESFTYSWDTSKLKDGNYLLKVKLDDRLSNPSGYMENERWGTITVDNTPPSVKDVSIVNAGKNSYALELRAEDKLSLITNATYKIDDGAPFAMMRVNEQGQQEAADSQTARLRAELMDVKPGQHKFVIEVTDQAGNTETKTVTLTVK